MSKKLFLAAVSVAALAFAGGAQADVISGAIGNGTFDKDGAYLVASERIVSAAKPLAGSITVTNALKTAINLTDGASRDYLVSFTLTGAEVGATSFAASAVDVLDGSVGASLVSSDDGVVTYLVTVKALAGKTVNVTHFALTAAVEQEAQASIVASGNVIALVGGSQIPFDTAKAVTALSYTPFFSSLTPTAVNATAALNDYTEFLDGAGPATVLTAKLGTVAGLSKAAADGKVYPDMTSGVADVDDLLDDDGVVTVTGPLITSDFFTNLKNAANALVGLRVATAEANTAVYKLTDAEAETLLTGGVSLELEQTSTLTKQAEIQAGSYTVSWAPKALAGFAVPSSSAVVGSVSLEGSNFYAPWVSGTGLATSVVRLSNNTNKVSGAVTVRLRNATKVTASGAAPFVTTAAPLVLAGVPAGGDLQITSARLVEHFGEFTRADLQITVNSADGAVTAKMRNTRPDSGQTFEQSLAAN